MAVQTDLLHQPMMDIGGRMAVDTGGEYVLRPYQVESIERLRDGIRHGHKKQILCSPTGSGKTLIAAHLVQEALSKGSRVGFVVDRLALVRQTSDRFGLMGIPHGKIQAANTHGRNERALVCSAQTLEKMDSWPAWDLLIVDECHSVRKKTAEFIKHTSIPVVGLSATPFTAGLNSLYTNVVNAITTDELLSTNDPVTSRPYLSPLLVYASLRAEIDMSGARRDSAGEWLAKEVEERGARIVGDAVPEWREKCASVFGGSVKTLVRSATVAHGEEICRAFQMAGYDFRQASYQSSDAETRALEEGFRMGEFTGLVSVDKFNKGFDVPNIQCLVDMRPLRKSLATEIQFLGRGMRAAPGKEKVVLLDHCGNYLGFMDAIDKFFHQGVSDLSNAPRKVTRSNKRSTPKPCARCGAVAPRGADRCPGCGKERGRRARVEHVKGKLGFIGGGKSQRGNAQEFFPNKSSTWRQLYGLAIERKGDDWSAAFKFAAAQYKGLYGEWPGDSGLPKHPRPETPTDTLREAVRRQLIAYFMRNKNRAGDYR